MHIEGKHTHIGFADESHYNKGRYPTLAVVSLKKEDYEPAEHVNDFETLSVRI